MMNDWMKQRDLGICPSGSRSCAKPDAAQVAASSVQRPVAVTESTPRDTPSMERTAILQQVANFKTHQQRFEREREDYFQKTMAMARANEWALQSRDKR